MRGHMRPRYDSDVSHSAPEPRERHDVDVVRLRATGIACGDRIC